jgi:CspA family cold shock protein
VSKGRTANRINTANATAQYEVDETDRRRLETGRVKFYNHDKRFGFVTPEDSTRTPVFLPGTAVRSAGLDGVYTGQRLEYVRVPDREGRADVANKIRLLEA